MFKIIAIETIPAQVDFAQCYPDIPEGLSELDIEIAKAKKERYDSTMRLLSAQDMNRRYLFCREYHFDKYGHLVRGTSLLPENFYNQKHDDKEQGHHGCYRRRSGRMSPVLIPHTLMMVRSGPLVSPGPQLPFPNFQYVFPIFIQSSSDGMVP